MKIEKIHHVAYRCVDAKATVEFYKKVLNMDLLGAIAEDRVPSTKAPDPYMHIFLDAGNGNILAFFELPNSPPMGRDPNTPEWTQHIAFQVKTSPSSRKPGRARKLPASTSSASPTTPSSSPSTFAIRAATASRSRPGPPRRTRSTA
ncbi:catechol 2,3-dioxygenase-like lactoylglutathione lyase family enzyme [Bradyrhizobium diazoefficiens]